MPSLCENWLRVKATSVNLCGRKPAEQPGRPQRHTRHGRSSGDRLGLRQPHVDCDMGKAELTGSRGQSGDTLQRVREPAESQAESNGHVCRAFSWGKGHALSHGRQKVCDPLVYEWGLKLRVKDRPAVTAPWLGREREEVVPAVEPETVRVQPRPPVDSSLRCRHKTPNAEGASHALGPASPLLGMCEHLVHSRAQIRVHEAVYCMVVGKGEKGSRKCTPKRAVS